MSYREHGMWEVLEVLRRLHRGERRRSIARCTGRSRKTIGRYADTARKLGWKPGECEEPDEALAGAVVARLRPGPSVTAPDGVERILAQHTDRLRDWLAVDEPCRRPLKLTKIHRLLTREGVSVSYSGLYRFAVKHFDFGRGKSTVRMAATEPGELAEVDFGRLGLVLVPETGKRRVLHALVVTLVFSRHQYVHVTHSQKLEDLVRGLEEAWSFFGGVPARVILDNLKAAVTKPDRYDPWFQRTFEEYARHRDFVIDAALPRHAKGKPHVERQVPFVRESFFRGERFLSCEHAQQEAVRWCQTTAGMRIHGTTRQRPLVVFENLEKANLKPLGDIPFDPPKWAEPKVHPDHHVKFNYALYSVPHPYLGRKVTLRADSKLVRIYFRGELVKTHALQPPGGRSTDHNDYPPEKTAYTMRDADYLIRKAGEAGEHIGIFTQQLLSGTYPWAHLRQAQKLLRMTGKYGDQRVDAACQRALSFGLLNVRRVQNIVERAMENADIQSSGKRGRVVPSALRFLRDPRTFSHNHRVGEIDDGHQNEP